MIRTNTNLRNIETDDAGRWVEIPILVVSPEGEEREYVLRDLSDDDLVWLLQQLDDMDVEYGEPGYDPRALVGYR